MSNLISSVQIALDTAAIDGQPITDREVALGILADLFGMAQYTGVLEDQSGGVWYADVPVEIYEEAVECNGLILTHSSGAVFEIPMP